MTNRSRNFGARVVLLVLAIALAGTALVAAPSQADPAAPGGGGGGKDVPADASVVARKALSEAEKIFSRKTGGPDREATLALRDLALHRDALTGTDRAAADALLARPSTRDCKQRDGFCYKTKRVKSKCSEFVCVHWVTRRLDRKNASTTSYANQVLEEMNYVHGTYVASGYRAPYPDGKRGGNSKPDIYLAQIGPMGLYGYCTTDDPGLELYEPTWAYCVLDNDYRPSEFPTNTPIENMQVTAAHEYYHAVQYGYDFAEDRWLLEATATWAEDELYNDVNDNLNYLGDGQISHPELSLDMFGTDDHSLFHYGNWLFFRFLTERYPALEGSMPALLLRIWENADMTGGEPSDQYSLQAVENALAEEGLQLDDAFAEFAAANASPAEFYSEGAVNGYPEAPLGTLSGGSDTVTLDHLSSATYRIVPEAGDSNLHVDVDVNDTDQGGVAVYTVKPAGASAFTANVALGNDGAGSFDYPLANVQWVTVTLANASDRFTCWQGTNFSCQGEPLDDGGTATIDVAVD